MTGQTAEIIALLQIIVSLLTTQLALLEAKQAQNNTQETAEITTNTTEANGESAAASQHRTSATNTREVTDDTDEPIVSQETATKPSQSSSRSGTPTLTFDEDDFDHVFDGVEITKTETVSGANNILIKNCYVHDTAGDGIILRDVKNVVITNCRFENIGGQAAVRGSISGGTEDVLLYNNTVDGVAENGFNFGQRAAQGIQHKNLRIIGNTIKNTGRKGRSGLTHGIYVQAQDFEIAYNVISGRRDGNAISVRSSGEVVGNTISGTSAADKPGIRYYSDHQTGPSETLRIEDNVVRDARIGIDLFAPVSRYDGRSGSDHVVKHFVITNNDVSDSDTGISIASAYEAAPFSITQRDN